MPSCSLRTRFRRFRAFRAWRFRDPSTGTNILLTIRRKSQNGKRKIILISVEQPDFGIDNTNNDELLTLEYNYLVIVIEKDS